MKNKFLATGLKLSTLFTLLATTGCAQYHRNILNSICPRGTEFTVALAKEYEDLGVIEQMTMYDDESATYYFEKAILAKEGLCVAPTILEKWDIDCENRPELMAAWNRLVLALQFGAPVVAPKAAAHAQAHFDCWVEQQSEGWQTDDIARCRSEFYKSMADVEFKLMGGEQKVIPPHSVLFDLNSSHLTPEAKQVVDEIADMASSHKYSRHIILIGRTDKVGDSKHNKNLAHDRTNAVKDELVRHGVPPHLITLKAVGETSGPQVDKHNRRVDIIFLRYKS